MLSVNDLLPTTEAYLTLPSFHYTVSPETQGTTDPPLTISNISKSSNLYVAILILVFCIVIFIRQLLKTKINTTLVLDITDGNSCIQLNVQSLPSNIISCHFMGSNILTGISITKNILPRVTINWGDLILTNTLLKTEEKLKSVIVINPYKAFCLRQMLKGKFSMFLWINHNNTSVPVAVCNPPCRDCMPNHAISTSACKATLMATSETASLIK